MAIVEIWDDLLHHINVFFNGGGRHSKGLRTGYDEQCVVNCCSMGMGRGHSFDEFYACNNIIYWTPLACTYKMYVHMRANFVIYIVIIINWHQMIVYVYHIMMLMNRMMCITSRAM